MAYMSLEEIAAAKAKKIAELDKTLRFGKYAGKKLSEVPVSYLQWMCRKCNPDWSYAASEWLDWLDDNAPEGCCYCGSTDCYEWACRNTPQVKAQSKADWEAFSKQAADKRHAAYNFK